MRYGGRGRCRLDPMNKPITDRKGVSSALFAAMLFGISTPLAKILSPQLSPILLAGLLYLGSGTGLGLYSLAARWSKKGESG